MLVFEFAFKYTNYCFGYWTCFHLLNEKNIVLQQLNFAATKNVRQKSKILKGNVGICM